MTILHWLDALDIASFGWGVIVGAVIALVIATILFWGSSTTPAERRRARVEKAAQPVWMSWIEMEKIRNPEVLIVDREHHRFLVRRRA
jgi:hypothetical protein